MSGGRIAFLASGGGGNLRLVHALASQGALATASVVAVIADRECPALEWARKSGIPAHLVPYSRAEPAALHTVMEDIAADVVVTNVHKILDEDLVDRHAGRLVNLHYSLLPAFAGTIGMVPVVAARAAGSRLIGATAHLVTATVDAGPILAQACVADDPARPIDMLSDDVFRCGGVALTTALEHLLGAPGSVGGELDAGGTRIFAGPLPGAEALRHLATPEFWKGVA